MSDTDDTAKTALVVGASRAIGLALAAALQERGWRVVATERGHSAELHELEQRTGGGVSIEHLDVTDPDQIVALRNRLTGTRVDLLYVNAGVTDEDLPIAAVTTDDFVHVVVTNALSPLRVVEGLGSLVPPDGTIAVMSSRQGSVSLNETGGHEVYRASKSALNQLVRSYAARHHDDPRTLLLIHPGWVQTELGGPGAPLTVAESVRGVVDVVERHAGDGGLQFLDHRDRVVPW